jgi:hypothetical protein
MGDGIRFFCDSLQPNDIFTRSRTLTPLEYCAEMPRTNLERDIADSQRHVTTLNSCEIARYYRARRNGCSLKGRSKILTATSLIGPSFLAPNLHWFYTNSGFRGFSVLSLCCPIVLFALIFYSFVTICYCTNQRLFIVRIAK